MKNYVAVIISFIMLFGLLGVNKVLSQNDQLGDVLIQYFDALKTGNLEILESILSDDLLQRRNKALKNPRYSEFLKNIYGHSEFKVINITQSNTGLAIVDFEIISGSQTHMNETITFIKQHGIWKLHKNKKNAVDKER